ncbi:acyltransferase [Sphingobacterium sp. lm-10]|uniref:acyltransferase family protein n=1 Tax=Sphingobacterium sp. lm-10 TaxID=2944904 RepID=UPI00202160CB|nr:acyltransferase [Sphingobacterium sp. lm-10]MCL7986576.1 acyltransferase [Sphingobacterium sp. lm-10]
MQKQHFLALDGLRGIAAIAIVVFHFMEWIFPQFEDNVIGHGFLAVDFFFCLSGFVMGYAYDERLKTMRLRDFFTLRLIRLQPLVIVGSVLGLIGLLWAPYHTAHNGNTTENIQLFIYSIFLIPYPVLEEKAFNLFSLNAPAWSLFWEYVANIIYAFVLVRITAKHLFVLAALAALALVYVSYSYGNLAGGWSIDNWEVGGIRLAYSFCAGLLIYRKQWVFKNQLGYIVPILLLVLAVIMPFTSLNWLIESLIVLFLFPLIVALGAGTTTPKSTQSVSAFLGAISYPLYMTHYAAMWIFGDYLQSEAFREDLLPLIVVGGSIGLIVFAYIIMKAVDIPVRKYLRKRYLKIT